MRWIPGIEIWSGADPAFQLEGTITPYDARALSALRGSFFVAANSSPFLPREISTNFELFPVPKQKNQKDQRFGWPPQKIGYALRTQSELLTRFQTNEQDHEPHT